MFHDDELPPEPTDIREYSDLITGWRPPQSDDTQQRALLGIRVMREQRSRPGCTCPKVTYGPADPECPLHRAVTA